MTDLSEEMHRDKKRKTSNDQNEQNASVASSSSHFSRPLPVTSPAPVPLSTSLPHSSFASATSSVDISIDQQIAQVEHEITKYKSMVLQYMEQEMEYRAQSDELDKKIQSIDDESEIVELKTKRSSWNNKWESVKEYFQVARDLLNQSYITLQELKSKKRAETSLYSNLDAPVAEMKFKNLSFNPEKASGFVSSQQKIPCNIAFNGNMFIPLATSSSIVRDFLTSNINPLFKTSAASLLPPGYFFSMFPVAFDEKPKPTYESPPQKTMDEHLMKRLVTFFNHKGPHKLCCNNLDQSRSLAAYGASVGPATGGSIPDLLCCFEVNDQKKIPIAIAEFKSTAFSTTEPHGQAAVAATNIALLHVKIGLPRDKIAIPFILTNGMLFQFGWVTIIPETLPVVILTSRILQTSHDLDYDEIVTYLARLKSFCIDQTALIAAALQSQTVPVQLNNVIRVNMESYHFKNVKDIYQPNPDRQQSFFNLMTVFSKLSTIEEAVKPIGFVRVDEQGADAEYDALIFPRVPESFRHGFPPDIKDREQFMKSLKSLLKRIHQAGVVHMDVYPSNIFWRVENGHVEIKIIDWDAATLVGDTLTENMRQDINRQSSIYYKRDITASAKFDAWFLYLMQLLPDQDQKRLRVRAPFYKKINSSFHEAVTRNFPDAQTDEFVEKFEKWFVEKWNVDE